MSSPAINREQDFFNNVLSATTARRSAPLKGGLNMTVFDKFGLKLK